MYARHRAGLDRTRAADAIHLVLLEFPGGALGQITIDRLCKAGTRYVELRADCEHASLRASYGGRALFQAGLKRAERPGIRLVYGLGGVAWIERGTSRKTIAPQSADIRRSSRRGPSSGRSSRRSPRGASHPRAHARRGTSSR